MVRGNSVLSCYMIAIDRSTTVCDWTTVDLALAVSTRYSGWSQRSHHISKSLFLCQSVYWNSSTQWTMLVRERSALATLIITSRVCLSFVLSFCLSATSELNFSVTRPDSGMVPIDSLYKLTYGLSIAHDPDDVTWPDNVIMVTSWFFFKMLLLQQFLSELDDTLTQCSTILCVYMVLMDSRSGTYDVTDDVIT